MVRRRIPHVIEPPAPPAMICDADPCATHDEEQLFGPDELTDRDPAEQAPMDITGFQQQMLQCFEQFNEQLVQQQEAAAAQVLGALGRLDSALHAPG